MRRALIKPDACKNCPVCSADRQCPGAAVIRESAGDKPWIDFYKCRGCMKCLGFCRNGAVGEITHPCTGKPGMGR